MSWIITGTEKYETDPYRSQVSLLLHGDGTSGSTTITDSSPTPKTVTASGNAQISTAQSKFGGSSIAFDGNADYISSGSDSSFQFETVDFTIEMWARFNAISDQLLYDTLPINGLGTRFSGFAFVLNANGRLNVYSANQFRGASTAVLSSNTWYHLALCRSASNWTYFVNGVNSGGYTQSLNITDSNFLLGKVGDSASYYVNAYIDDLRITKGVARYTSNFTPPTAPFPDI